MRKILAKLVLMDPVDINREAIKRLDKLLERCTINLVAKLTGITRPTLYRWLDESIPLDNMDHRQAAWFIMHCESNPKLMLLMSRPPLSKPRLAKRLVDDLTGDKDE